MGSIIIISFHFLYFVLLFIYLFIFLFYLFIFDTAWREYVVGSFKIGTTFFFANELKLRNVTEVSAFCLCCAIVYLL